LASLEHDATEIIANGMVTLSTKLNGIGDEKMISRVVDLWTFFWGQVLPYVEGVSSFMTNETIILKGLLGPLTSTNRPPTILSIPDAKEPQTIVPSDVNQGQRSFFVQVPAA
jgi:hypothetical protein